MSAETSSVIERAKQLYASKLQENLESRHRDRFVAIEPESGEYFLGDTFDEAVKAARSKHSTGLTHTIRIGHRAAFHIGVLQRRVDSISLYAATQAMPAMTAAATAPPA